MIPLDLVDGQRIRLSKSQQNIFNGVLQDGDPALYLIGRRYRFQNMELAVLLAALEATIDRNPIQLCVLEPPSEGYRYPDLVPRLRARGIVDVQPDGEYPIGGGGEELQRAWQSGILAAPLVRYTVRVDGQGHAAGLDAYTHHLLLDGGGTGIVEADLGRHIASGGADDVSTVGEGLTKLAEAHRWEAWRVAESEQRLAAAAKREITEDAGHGGYGQTASDAPGTAAKGVLRELVSICGAAYDAILTVAETTQVPLNVLMAAAAVAVDASLRQSTESLLVHAVDNRFGDPELNVATCLVNSVAQPVRFPAFASVEDVVRELDRGYVKAVRRRWLREERYRRLYLAINRTSHVEALTLNFLRQPCAPELRPFLSEVPVTTDIGPVESRTVAGVLDEERRTLHLAIWDRADHPVDPPVAPRIAAVLESMAAMWHQPIAKTVGEWKTIGPDGSLARSDTVDASDVAPAPAWFADPAADVRRAIEQRRHVDPWVAWLLHNGFAPGDVVVLADDGTDKTIDFLIACHLAGCGYSVCDSADEIPLRVASIASHEAGSVHAVDVAAAEFSDCLDADLWTLVEDRIQQAAHDPMLTARTAYIMATSGSTGEPKLVRVTHGSLALFCAAIRRAYGWEPADTVLQCAPLTSDISVEEIFGAAFCGSRLVRSSAMTAGDLPALATDLATRGATIMDLPTAMWHLLCEDRDATAAIKRSGLRQVVIGGELIRPRAVETWIESVATHGISLVSTYGPTESTVVVTHLPVVYGGSVLESGARRRVGRPIVPGTVIVAFGEVVIVGDLVSTGYLGFGSNSFGVVIASDGSRHRAFATADRVSLDDGFPVFSGRRDAIVKISGKRVDTAEVARRVAEDPAVTDVAVELHDGGLGVWFETSQTRGGGDDPEAEIRIRSILVGMHVPSFFVMGLPGIPRKANGKADSEQLRAIRRFTGTVRADAQTERRAAGLAEIWSRHLGRPIRPDSSLLDEGIGSLDLIRILPETRTYLRRHLTILDLISADSAAHLVDDASVTDSWMDVDTVAQIERDFAAVQTPHTRAIPGLETVGGETVLVLGASGILGTGFAEAVLDLRRSGADCPEVIFAARTKLLEGEPWAALAGLAGVRTEHISSDFGAAELHTLIGDVGARTVVNCIGNTNVLVPYRELRSANVELVSTMAEVCARHGARLVHSSTYVVNGEAGEPRVVDPRDAPYPYAASKSLAELIMAGSSGDLDFTVVRLPRVLGELSQLLDSADILVSVVDACVALQAYPAVRLTEQVTTGRAAASGLLGLLPGGSGTAELGRGITVVRGEAVEYAEFLGAFACDEVDVAEWKRRLDRSAWAARNPRRWSVIDAWISLGMRLGSRSYAEYLAEYPTIGLEVESVAELATRPGSLRALLDPGADRSATPRRELHARHRRPKCPDGRTGLE
ncbi:AMP-binding protein [Candidatus Mycolicibacterium alkanivorans]|uniref:AMP-binding protein n=1 Tax=Candidatus Mycolicibacterium alkanivorans TaxID=2954114 RepID=A0ABS9YZI7_9MYCO|nr:AMP-binding protein [Candidatus Mycolicibacterium alkanivorans]MCI4676640.1 AMP-binding protein [Candidatus Mycolicibacterium alkanivorans]